MTRTPPELADAGTICTVCREKFEPRPGHLHVCPDCQETRREERRQKLGSRARNVGSQIPSERDRPQLVGPTPAFVSGEKVIVRSPRSLHSWAGVFVKWLPGDSCMVRPTDRGLSREAVELPVAFVERKPHEQKQ